MADTRDLSVHPTDHTSRVAPVMAELARARKELSAWLYKGVTGTRVHERVAQLVDDHQSAVKDAHAHQLAEEIREAGSHLGHNTNLAYRRVADLIDPAIRPVAEDAAADGDDTCHTVEVDGAPVLVRGAGAMDAESAGALTALVRAATRRFAEDQAAIVQQVITLQRSWLKDGAPPLGTSVSRWWDARLVELRDALRAPDDALSRPGDAPVKARDRWAFQFLGVLSDLDRCQHGRHEGDPCGSCGGLSTGNPRLADGRVLGYGVHGNPIVLPTRDRKADPAAWRLTKES